MRGRPAVREAAAPAPALVLVLVLVLVAAVGAGGCGGRVVSLNEPAPPPTSPPVASTTTTTRNLTAVSLAAVAGQVRPLVGLTPGAATLGGTIVGPAGPVGGADIHIERLVGNDVATLDVTARPDGTWSLPRVLGGRYRVRAWRSPDLALTSPAIFYLQATETWSMTLRLQQFGQPNLVTVITPDPPMVDQPAALTVQLTTQTVDAGGIVRAAPVAGASIALSAGGTWSVGDPNPTETAADGTASWQLVCAAPGPQPLAVTVNNVDAYPVNVADCTAPPPPTTTVPATSTTTPGNPTTTA